MPWQGARLRPDRIGGVLSPEHSGATFFEKHHSADPGNPPGNRVRPAPIGATAAEA